MPTWLMMDCTTVMPMTKAACRPKLVSSPSVGPKAPMKKL
jgi:hypothetical protein